MGGTRHWITCNTAVPHDPEPVTASSHWYNGLHLNIHVYHFRERAPNSWAGEHSNDDSRVAQGLLRECGSVLSKQAAAHDDDNSHWVNTQGGIIQRSIFWSSDFDSNVTAQVKGKSLSHYHVQC